MKTDTVLPAARAATLNELLRTVVPLFVCPIPKRDTLRVWLDKAAVPRLKANPCARRGGGAVYYQVAAVEKYFRSRTIPGGAR